MTEDKKIEEMAKIVCHLDRTCDECMTSFDCKAMMYAKRFYGAGYRKSADVAREIFANINELKEQWASGDMNDDEFYKQLYKLEKKYTEGEG